MLSFMLSPQTTPSETCMWSNRKPLSHRLKNENKCRFWPDNAVIICLEKKQNTLWQ